jgi:hypothetical protein
LLPILMDGLIIGLLAAISANAFLCSMFRNGAW